MRATTSVWFAILAATVAAAAAYGAESGTFRVDARGSYGGRVGTGMEWVGEVDGSAVRQWDTTAAEDGWTTLESKGSAAEVCVLNAPAVEGGVSTPIRRGARTGCMWCATTWWSARGRCLRWNAGRLVDSIDGERDWAEVGVKVRGQGVHTLAWTYSKDWFDEKATEDCGWVDQVTWTPTVTDEDVPLSWLADLGLVDAGMSNEDAAALDVDGDGFTAAQEYLAGTDPTDADSVLLTGLEFPEGRPEVTWTPDLEGERDYRVLAKKALDDKKWTDVTEVGDRSEWRFFTVDVRPAE